MNDGFDVFVLIALAALVFTFGMLAGVIQGQPEKVEYKKQSCIVYEKLLYCEETESGLVFE